MTAAAAKASIRRRAIRRVRDVAANEQKVSNG